MTQEVIEQLVIQLEASKQMFNEAINQCFQLKTAVLSLSKEVQKLKQELIQPKEEPKNATDKVTEQGS